jgi:hypothetical protein
LPRLINHVVAVQVAFERQTLKPVFHLIGARVETTWVPGAFQLWVRGSQRAPPDHVPHFEHDVVLGRPLSRPLNVRGFNLRRCVAAVHVAFYLKANFETVSHLMGSRGETRRFQAMGKLDSRTCAAPPWGCTRGRTCPRAVAAQVDPFESKGLKPGAFQTNGSVESKGLKPGYRISVSRVETTWVPGAFQVWVQGESTAVSPPTAEPAQERRLSCAAVSANDNLEVGLGVGTAHYVILRWPKHRLTRQPVW